MQLNNLMELFVLFYMIGIIIDLCIPGSLILLSCLNSLPRNNHGIHSLCIPHRIELCCLIPRFEIATLQLAIGIFIACGYSFVELTGTLS
jgi:hypothetical protein